MEKHLRDTTDPTPADGAPRDLVLLTHGIASNKYLLLPLARRLRGLGYETRLWGYSSLFRPIEKHGRRLADKLRLLAGSGQWGRVHVVAHSMGSIVTRCALHALEPDPPPGVGRVVMLGPPNGGSHMATFLTPIYGWFSKSLVQLRDTPDSFVNRLPPPPAWAEVGVLAAAEDNVIYLSKTHIAGEKDHRVVDSWHTGMLWTRETAELSAAFLRHGRFVAEAKDATAKPEPLTPSSARSPSLAAGRA